MRFLNIFLLYFQHVLNFRGRIFVWFLNAFLNPLFLLLFWIGIYREGSGVLAGWSLSDIASYYFLLVIAGSVILAHIEEDVAIRDIKDGELVKYLTKPISYFVMKFFNEMPWRIIQGSFGLIVFIIVFLMFRNFISIPDSIPEFVLALIVTSIAILISFTFKMIIGITAFWLTDFWGFQQVVEVIILIFGGFIMPVHLFPEWLSNLSFLTPFPYMIYYPILSFQGKMSNPEMLQTIFIQIIWILFLVIIYKMMWRKGIKKFTGVGN